MKIIILTWHGENRSLGKVFVGKKAITDWMLLSDAIKIAKEKYYSFVEHQSLISPRLPPKKVR